MSRYVCSISNVVIGSTPDTFVTMLAIISADTAGHRARLRRLAVAGSMDAPVNGNIAVKLNRVSDVSAGGAGTSTAISAANMAKKDSASLATVITGGHTFTVEPTVYDTKPLFEGEFNAIGGKIDEAWSSVDAPTIDRDMLLGVLVSPRVSTVNAAPVTITLEYEQF